VLGIEGDVVQYGGIVYGQSIDLLAGSGVTILEVIPVSSGCSADFNYCVTENGGAMRSGTVKGVWNNVMAGYTDYSTTDIMGSTSDVVFTVDVFGGNVRLIVNINSGIWRIKLKTQIII
jgi:hypothetical protein